jgi:uncharacterized membrane protein YgcG
VGIAPHISPDFLYGPRAAGVTYTCGELLTLFQANSLPRRPGPLSREDDMPTELVIVALAVAAVFLFAVAALALMLIQPWLRGMLSGAPVMALQILGMRLRGTPANLLVDAFVQLRARGRDVEMAEVERQYLAQRQRVREAIHLVDLVEKSLA